MMANTKKNSPMEDDEDRRQDHIDPERPPPRGDAEHSGQVDARASARSAQLAHASQDDASKAGS